MVKEILHQYLKNILAKIVETVFNQALETTDNYKCGTKNK